MARPSPSARVDSKNTVSPIAIAVTIESASSPRAPVDAAANAPTPAVAVTQPSRSAPPTVARAARSEERRVGKECRSRWSPAQYNKKQGHHARLITAHTSKVHAYT